MKKFLSLFLLSTLTSTTSLSSCSGFDSKNETVTTFLDIKGLSKKFENETDDEKRKIFEKKVENINEGLNYNYNIFDYKKNDKLYAFMEKRKQEDAIKKALDSCDFFTADRETRPHFFEHPIYTDKHSKERVKNDYEELTRKIQKGNTVKLPEYVEDILLFSTFFIGGLLGTLASFFYILDPIFQSRIAKYKENK